MTKRARELLRDNLDRLIAAGEVSHTALARTGKISNGTLGRVHADRLTTGTKIDTLDDLCAAMAVLGRRAEPWQLIHPDGVAAGSPNLGFAAGLAAKIHEISDPALQINIVNKLDYLLRWIIDHPLAEISVLTEQPTASSGPSARPTQVLQIREQTPPA